MQPTSVIQPSSRLSLPLASLRRLLAESSAWQQWTRTADATAAARRIHLIDIPRPEIGENYTLAELNGMRPLAVIEEFVPPGIFWGDGYVAKRVAGGSRSTFIDSGRLMLMLEADVPDQLRGRDADAKIDFLNHAGAALEGMLALSGVDDHLALRGVREFLPAVRAEIDEQNTKGDYFRIGLMCEWGM